MQARAAQLLGPPQHASDALRLLLDALGEVDREIEKAQAEVQRDGKGLGKTRLPEDPLKDKEKTLKDLGKLAKASDKTIESLRRVLAGQERKAPLLERLASYSDDRVVAAIVRSEKAAPTDAGARALLALGSRPALEAALAAFASWEATPAPRDDELAQQHAARGTLFQEGLAALAQQKGLAPPASSRSVDWQAWWKVHAASFPGTLPGVRAPAW